MQTALSLSLEANAARSSAVARTNEGDSNEAVHRQSSFSRTRGTSNQPAARASPSIRVRFDASRIRKQQDGQVRPAILGNHLAIQQFLQQQLHEPSRAEFAALANRPGYEASQRLIMQHGPQRQLLGHVHVQPAVMRFGSIDVPIARLRHFAMFPEFRIQGHADVLLTAAEKYAKNSGAMLCVARGGEQDLLGRHSWVHAGYDPVSIVTPQRLLGQLPAPATPESPFYGAQMPEYYVRIGRLTDLHDMKQLYENHLSSQHGTVIRDDEYWSWLVSRGAHHRIFMFFEADVPRAYIVVRHASVLELVDSTEDGRGAARLLEQVGADAIEQGRYSLRIHAPIDDPVHRWADKADGRLYIGDAAEAWQVKVTSFRALLRRLAPEMFRSQRRQNVVERLGVRIGSETFCIARGVRSMKVTRNDSAKHRIGLTQKAATQLMLGYRSADQLADNHQLVANSDDAMRSARILFPTYNLWRTQWDDSPVV